MFSSWSHRCLLAFASLFMLLMGASAAQAQSSPLKLSYVAPDQCILFVTWNGWTDPDPKSTNRTEKLFAEQSLKDFGNQLMDEINKVIDSAVTGRGNEEATVAAKTVPTLAKLALKHPGALYLKGFKPDDNPEIEAAVVIDAEKDGPQAVDAFKKLLALIPKEGPQGAVEEKIGDATFLRPKEYRPNEPEIRIGYRASQMIVLLGKETPKELLAKLAKPGQPPAWLAQISRELVVERPSMLVYFDAQKLLKTLEPIMTDPMAPKVLEVLGVHKLKSFAGVSGLDKIGMHSVSMLTTEGTPTGLFDLIPDKPLTIGDFKDIPATASNTTVCRFDLAYFYDKVLGGIEAIDPNARQQIEGRLAAIEPQLGFSLKNDVLEGLGDTWSWYTSASEPGIAFVPGVVITASIRKQAGVEKALNVIVAAAQGALAASGGQAPFSIQEFTAKGEKGYRIVLNNLPFPLPIQPSWLLTKDQLIIGMTSQLVSSHLSATSKGSLADNEHLKAAFKWNSKPTSVSYSDPKPVLQTVYTLVNTFGPMLTTQLAQQGVNFNLPPLPPMADLEQHLLPTVSTFGRTANGWKSESHGVIPSGVEIGPAFVAVGAALLLPAVQQAREAARRAQGRNNLKQIGLAMHNYHDVHKTFPPAATVDKKKKPLLSWRVHVLPFVDQAPLYQQFHLDEPWDSEHNKQFIKQIPPVYLSPNHGDLAKDGKTVYLVPTGEGAAFEGNEGLGIRSFVDGTSNTILAVEAHRDAAVIWTKPDDLILDFKDPIKNLKSARVGGFHALMSDGAVRFISDAINPETLKALFTRGGGEALGAF